MRRRSHPPLSPLSLAAGNAPEPAGAREPRLGAAETHLHERRTFTRERLEAGAHVHDQRFLSCTFEDCNVGPGAFTRIERAAFESTRVLSKNVLGLVLRDVTVDACRGRTFMVTSCLFDRVTVRGSIDLGCVVHFHDHLVSDAQRREAETFYDQVEWALDIREATFKDIRISGVPGDKIRRDPERHFRLRLDRLAADPSWRSRFDDDQVTRLDDWISWRTEVLVACEGWKHRSKSLDFFRALRAAGYAE